MKMNKKLMFFVKKILIVINGRFILVLKKNKYSENEGVYMLKNNFCFDKNVRMFEIEGIKMIGNTANGSIIGLDDDGDELVQKLMNNQSLTEEDLNEKTVQILECMKDLGFFEGASNDSKLKAAYLHLTDRCNLNCIGCYSYVENRNTQDVLPFESICRILDELTKNGVEELVFSGGEPFIRKDIADICRYAKEVANIKSLSVITNGTMLYERHLNALQYIDILNISIDGYNEETQFIRDTGIMKRIVSNIEYLKPLVSLNLIATIHKRNLEYAQEYINFANDLGVRLSFSIFTVDPNNEEFKDYIFDNKSLVDFSKKVLTFDEDVPIMDMPTGEVCLTCRGNCEVGKEMVSIAADGSIYPCHMLHDNELRMGNILQDELGSILKSEENVFNFLTVEEVNGCKDCSYRYLCGGGCRGRSWLYNKTLTDRDSYCPFIKTFYRGTVKRLKETITQ